MAGCGQASRQAASRRRPTLCGLRAGAGASDNRTRVRAPAGAALSPLPPRGHAATANGARRSRAGRRGAAEGRADRAAGKYALGRCSCTGSCPHRVGAPRRPPASRWGQVEGQSGRQGGGRVRTSVEVIGMVNLDMSADVDSRKGSKGRTNAAGGAVPPLRKGARRCAPGTPASGGSTCTGATISVTSAGVRCATPRETPCSSSQVLTACRRPRVSRS